ncbi:MAG TPA: mechanosensitive ion channel family protein [Thermomicrobiales bacterium]|nr:mechanosensitive ion channel family protein [Chloroflexota bacterium]HCG28382.1 mechanosensitive ion channel family protein [Chloroflexota bacterium]HQX62235.1 mechanosensitive ion channel family protein [Thermomicrobiales bacterium]HRA32433.1 mechanosensitive ion channel family protein [Thermomicrobiales bacterium]
MILGGMHLFDSLTPVLSLTMGDILVTVREITSGDIGGWLLGLLSDTVRSILRIVMIVVISLVLIRLLRVTIRRIVTGVLSAQTEPTPAQHQRADTLGRVTESTGRVIVIIIATMMVLSNLGFDLAPLIASAGLAGIAIGLGAQSLVRDMLNGFFILFEDQYGVGDFITVGAHSGTVEAIDLRRTVLRAIDGSQIVVPNGEIRVLENQSKGWSRAVLAVQAAPNADDAQVIATLNEVLAEVQNDPKLNERILEPPLLLGITAVTAIGVTYSILVKTEPLQQWAVERELRALIREAFRVHDIPVPLVTTTLPAAEG